MVTHGRDGWELVDYDWDPQTGVASFLYERPGLEPGTVEEFFTTKAQPTDTKHAGWYMR